jgi:hypothetical protein
MMPGTETSDSAVADPPVKIAKPRGKGRAKSADEASGTGQKPIARILQLIAALKAEQDAPATQRKAPPAGEPSVAPAEAPSTAPSDDSTEPVSVLSSLRDILVAREQERNEWEDRERGLLAELAEARAATRTARDAVNQAEAQHRRVVADLKLLHEHQRSIWQLERRRFEITIEGFEREHQKKLVKTATRLARPALIAGLLIVLVALAMLSGDSGAASGGAHAPRLDAGHSTSGAPQAK